MIRAIMGEIMSIWHWLIIIAVFAVGGAVVSIVAVKIMHRTSYSRWFWYGFALFPVAALHIAVIGLGKGAGAAAKAVSLAIIVIVTVAFYQQLYSKYTFSDRDIYSLKDQIRKEFSSREGVAVSSVELVRESPQKLTGFVKVSAMGSSATIACNAFMDPDDASIIWRCE